MNLELIKAIVVLPGTVLVYVPAGILWVTAGTPHEASIAGIAQARYWAGALVFASGLVFAVWTMRLFATAGEGTPAPWAPPRRLVVLGPYRHVRNPMITSVLAMLAGESLLSGSWPLASWMVVFFVLSWIAFVNVEEPGLERRFGEDYRRYKANVPRWVPRATPWEGNCINRRQTKSNS